jgi:hypothetical protein
VLSRCTATLALLSVTLIGASAPSQASAASIVSEMMVNGVDTIVPNGTAGSTKYAYYELSNPQSTAPDNALVVGFAPPNSVQPANASTSPLTPVGGSFGFQQPLTVLQSPSNPQLAILFDMGDPKTPGQLNFKVSLDPNYSSMTPPTLTLLFLDPVSLAATVGPELTSYTPTVANGAPPAAAPEPVSLALWSALAGAGLLRARAFRRSRRAALVLG